MLQIFLEGQNQFRKPGVVYQAVRAAGHCVVVPRVIPICRIEKTASHRLQVGQIPTCLPVNEIPYENYTGSVVICKSATGAA
jgi:hypothetical protein